VAARHGAQGETFTLTGADGKTLPLQNWPLAYWPDGSMKFIGFATVAGPSNSGAFKLARARRRLPLQREGGRKRRAIDIDTGRLQCASKAGCVPDRLDDHGRRVVARHGRLVCTLDDRSEFTSSIRKVTVEQTGPVRAVIKIEGVHQS